MNRLVKESLDEYVFDDESVPGSPVTSFLGTDKMGRRRSHEKFYRRHVSRDSADVLDDIKVLICWLKDKFSSSDLFSAEISQR
ncbi:hypothetical protein V3C99_004893 [Haemonchus contortus]